MSLCHFAARCTVIAPPSDIAPPYLAGVEDLVVGYLLYRPNSIFSFFAVTGCAAGAVASRDDRQYDTLR